MLPFARALKDRGVPVPEIAKKPTIKTGKNAGQHPWPEEGGDEDDTTDASSIVTAVQATGR